MDESLDVALVRQAADEVASIARAGWMGPGLRRRLTQLAADLQVAAEEVAGEARAHHAHVQADALRARAGGCAVVAP